MKWARRIPGQPRCSCGDGPHRGDRVARVTGPGRGDERPEESRRQQETEARQLADAQGLELKKHAAEADYRQVLRYVEAGSRVPDGRGVRGLVHLTRAIQMIDEIRSLPDRGGLTGDRVATNLAAWQSKLVFGSGRSSTPPPARSGPRSRYHRTARASPATRWPAPSRHRVRGIRAPTQLGGAVCGTTFSRTASGSWSFGRTVPGPGTPRQKWRAPAITCVWDTVRFKAAGPKCGSTFRPAPSLWAAAWPRTAASPFDGPRVPN